MKTNNTLGLLKKPLNPLAREVALAAALVSSAGAWADGRLEGRVGDTSGKVFFDGAIVRLLETGQEVSTQHGGRFVFPALPAGSYTLSVDYLGADPVEKRVVVADERTTKEIVRIGKNVSVSENIIVVGQAAGASKALNRQRSADNFKAVVSADSIGQFPDENVSEALQRVSGVFIERDQGEGRFVGVRGLAPNLNSASINGVSIPSPESDTRSVALDVIPSALLEGLEVTKTLTPDMDADAIGGSIEIKSLSAFDRDGMTYNLSTESYYNDLQDNYSPKVAGTFTRVLDVSGGELGVALAASWQEREFGSEGIEGDGAWDSDIEDSGVRGAETLEQRDYEITRERLGVAFNLDWRPTDTAQYYLRTLYSDFEDEEVRLRANYNFDEGSLGSIGANSATWSDAEMERDIKDRNERQKIRSLVLGGSNMLDAWTAEYSVGYSKSSEDEPHRRDTVFKAEELDMSYSGLGETPNLFVEAGGFDASRFELDEIVIEDNYTEDTEWSYKLDVTRDMEFGSYPGMIKFGAKYRTREKSNDANAEIYDEFEAIGEPTLADFTGGSVEYALGSFGPRISKSALNNLIDSRILGSADVQSAQARAESLVSSARDYEMEEDITAAYIMSRVDINDLRIVYGLRYEQTDFSASGFNASLIDEETTRIEAVSFDNDYSNLLPSVNLRYRVSDTLIARAAYTESISRPSFGDLTPSPAEIEIEDGELTVEAGNPELEPFEAQNFDLALEYYPGDIGIIGVGLFYKKIDNFIFNADVSDVIDPTQFSGDIELSDVEVLMPLNGKSADLYGLELTYTKQFSELPAPFDGLLLQANATFTDSEADLGLGADAERDSDISLPRQADKVGNLVIGYERGPLSLRVSGAYKSDSVEVVDLSEALNDRIQDDHMQVDFSAKYDFSDQLQAHFNAINIGDEPRYFYHGTPRFNSQYEEYGRAYVLGVTYRNF